MNCPDCGSKRLKTLGIERSERLGDSCVLVVSGCGCEFMVTHWHIEIIKHDPIELMFMEPTE
jgi:hypothetical protein